MAAIRKIKVKKLLISQLIKKLLAFYENQKPGTGPNFNVHESS
jgi:hypothetical protein